MVNYICVAVRTIQELLLIKGRELILGKSLALRISAKVQCLISMC